MERMVTTACCIGSVKMCSKLVICMLQTTRRYEIEQQNYSNAFLFLFQNYGIIFP